MYLQMDCKLRCLFPFDVRLLPTWRCSYHTGLAHVRQAMSVKRLRVSMWVELGKLQAGIVNLMRLDVKQGSRTWLMRHLGLTVDIASRVVVRARHDTYPVQLR